VLLCNAQGSAHTGQKQLDPSQTHLSFVTRSHYSLGLVSHGQTLFHTTGKGLGHGHRATCRPTPWSAYQSQHSIQSHDTWSMWL